MSPASPCISEPAVDLASAAAMRAGWFRSASYSPNERPSVSAPLQGTDPDDQTPSSQGEPFGESRRGARELCAISWRPAELVPPVVD
ncbi:unnamed protein product, partial [Ixodes pacificus]